MAGAGLATATKKVHLETNKMRPDRAGAREKRQKGRTMEGAVLGDGSPDRGPAPPVVG